MKVSKYSNEKGFSLVELMVVVAIIGILASLAIPKLKVFQAKARQAEAKTNLSQIYVLEMTYYGDNDEFAVLDETGRGICSDGGENKIGFYLSNCQKSRYSYMTEEAGASKFEAVAKSGEGDENKIMPGCGTADKFTIDHEKVLKHEADSTKVCQ